MDSQNSPIPPGIGRARLAITGTTTLTGTHQGLTVDCTSGTFALNLTAAATLGSGWHVAIYNSGSGTVTVTANGAETIRNGALSATTLALTQGQGAVLECDGTGFGVIAAPTATTSGTLPIANGGTGTTSVVGSALVYGNGTSAYTSSANLTYVTNHVLLAANAASETAFTATNSSTTGYASLNAVNDTANHYFSCEMLGTAYPGTQAGIALADLALFQTGRSPMMLTTGNNAANPIYIAPSATLLMTLGASTVTMGEAKNLVLGTATGTKFGTATTQKLGFYNATPIVQPTGSLVTALSNLGLVTSGSVASTDITGAIPMSAGGTGTTSVVNTALVYGNGTTAYTSSANLTYSSNTVALAASGSPRIQNTSSLNTGASDYVNFNNLGNYAQFALYGSAFVGNYSATGIAYAGLTLVQASAGPLMFATGSSNNIYFAYNGQLAMTINAVLGMTLADGMVIALGTTTGTKFGNSTSQKIGFFNSTPIVQPSSTTDLRQALINLGLYATGGATPLNLNGGALTCDTVTCAGGATFGAGVTIPVLNVAGALQSNTFTTTHIVSTPGSAASGDTGRVEFRELIANGTNAVKLIAPDALAADVTLTLPTALPVVSGYALTGDTSGVLSWGPIGGTGYSGYIVLEDQQTTGTNGGTLVSTTWNTRRINTAVKNIGSYASSISANRFTLAAGTYRIFARAPGYKTDRSKLALYSVSGGLGTGVYVAYGECAYGPAADSGVVAHLSCYVTLASPNVFELRNYVANGVASGGGVETSDGSTEVYTHIEAYRE